MYIITIVFRGSALMLLYLNEKNDCTCLGSVHGFVMELKNLKFLLISCVTLNIEFLTVFYFNMMSTVK